MPGPRIEAYEPVALQQPVDPREREGLAELAIQNPLELPSTKRSDAVSWCGASLYSLDEASLLLGRQPSRAAGCRASTHRLDTTVTIRVHPTLHEGPTAAHGASDFKRLPPLQCEQHASKAIPLYRV
jgi:hypothetical protein